MKVFISWSGARSEAVARTLQWWLPKVVNAVEPFVSATDIDKGSNWVLQLTRELETTEFGIVCVTPENLRSPWLHYEAGAIARSVESRVCPVLYGVSKGEVGSPLNNLQLTDFGKEDMLLMLMSMNKMLPKPLSVEHLHESVGMWYERLSTSLMLVPAVSSTASEVAAQGPLASRIEQTELLKTILGEVGQLRRAQVGVVYRHDRSRFDPNSERISLRAIVAFKALLEREGLKVSEILVHGGDFIVLMGSVPNPLPGKAHEVLNDFSKNSRVRVAVHGDDATHREFPDPTEIDPADNEELADKEVKP